MIPYPKPYRYKNVWEYLFMKNRILSLFICLSFFIFLCNPSLIFTGASNGVLLWFHTVLPTLFPFIVMTSILIHTNALHMISAITSPILCPIFGVSKNASFAIIGGFLCGYPMGANIISELYKTKHISKTEGAYLLSFCNNASPAFIVSYICLQKLHRTDLIAPTLIILIGSIIVSSWIFRHFYSSKSLSGCPASKNISLVNVLDQAITNGMETITKIGGYIICFSILIALVEPYASKSPVFAYLLLPSLELTNGITYLSNASLPFSFKYFLILIHTSFGGICALFQTKCVLYDQEFSIASYIIEKLATTAVTSLLAMCYIMLFL